MKIVLASTSPRRRRLIKKITDDFTAMAAEVDEQAIEESVANKGGYKDEVGLAEMTVRELSRAKAQAVFDLLGQPEDTLVIGADTVVCLKNEILGKPKDRDDAVRMLRAQSMEPQQVYTGVTLIARGTFSSGGCPVAGCNDADRMQRSQGQTRCPLAAGSFCDEAKATACGSCCRGANWSSKRDIIARTFAEKTLVYFHPLDEAQEARIQAYCSTPEPYDKAGAYGIQDHGDVLVERYEGDYDNIVGFPTERIRKEIEGLKQLMFT